MRILVAHSFYRMPGGEDRYVREQVNLLRTRHVVHLEERVNADLPDGPATAAVMAAARGERAALRRALRLHRPDVIHLHNPYPSFGPAVHLAADRARIPLVHTVHNYRVRCPNGLLYTEGAPCSRCTAGRYDNAIHHGCFATKRQAGAYSAALWMHRFVLRLEDKVDLFVAPSQFVRRRLVAWGIGTDRVVVVRNFTVPPPDVPPLGHRGLFLGRLAPEKGLATLLDALSMAGDPPFDIVGSGPDAQRLAARAAELGLHNTHFHGYVPADAVAGYIAAARYIVAPSLWEEVFGLAALEAMAAGRPVVASDVGGLSELVGGGGGRLVARGDADALAGAVLAYADSEEAAARDGAMARRFVLDECSPEAHLDGLGAAYALAAVAQQDRDRRRRTAPATGAPEAGQGEQAHAGPTSIGLGRAPLPRLHVLMVHCYYRDLGGENLSFEAEVRLLRDAGIRVTTYTRDNRELDRTGLLGRARAGLRTTWAEDSYGDLRDLVRRERPDVVHFQNTFPLISPAALHAAHRLGRPIVQTLRNYRLLCASGVLYRDGRICMDCVGRLLPDPAIRHACYQGSVPRTTAVTLMQVTHRMLGTWTDAVDIYVAPSAFARDQFVRAGLPADRFVVKPNFVHPDPGIGPGDGGYVLYAGRLAPEKGVRTLIEAWTGDGLPPLRVVGEGPLQADLEALIVARRLNGRVELMGRQRPERVLELMRAARCLVFPSEWYETFGRVAAEAYACGVPVVASRLGAMAEIVDDGVTGRLVRPNDPVELAAAVRAVSTLGEELDGMRQAARAAYEARFTAERNLGLLLAIYERARKEVSTR
jgi:glycosyltransferase involved in cell wall biosynthesis